MGLTEGVPHIGWCVINVNTDPGKWENVCQKELTHSFPACVGQTNGKSTYSTDRVQKINVTLRRRNLVSLLQPAFPTPLHHNYRVNLQAWILRLNMLSPKIPLSVLALKLLLFHEIISFMFALNTFFYFPLRTFVCFCFLCSEVCLYNHTIIRPQSEK